MPAPRSILTPLAWLVALCAGAGHAEPLLPAPGDAGVDRQLADLAAGFQRQQDVFATAELGFQLDVWVNPADVATVQSFFAQSLSDDFQQVTGRHPFSVVSTFEEYGDEGNFAGTASLGVAARLMVLRRDGAPAAEVARARDAAVRAARAWHVYASIGGPGVVARGIRRTAPLNPLDPPLPGTLPATTPLFDDGGSPLPAQKGGTWREAVAGDGGWIWLDDTSKDQVIGYALAATWLYDALVGDALVPPEVTANLAADLAAFAHALMQVAPETGVDLSIRDADGRLTSFHDLNPRELTPGLVVPADATQNGFNATLALAIIRAAYHVSGDEQIARYYYDELVAKRRLPGLTPSLSSYVFSGPSTNFSNVNMLAIAYATLERVETDPAVRAQLQNTIQTAFWDTGNGRDCSHSAQPWFDVVYASFSPRADAGFLADRVRGQLAGFQPAPAFERDRVNCDAQEISAGSCLAVDGTTVIQLETQTGHGGSVVATAPLAMSIRPDSDHEWRADPFEVNGNASNLIDPRGDWLAAYWLGRLVDRDPAKNLSPNARVWPPPGPAPTPAPQPSGGCHCATGGPGAAWVLLAWATLRARRSGRRSG